MNERVAAAQTRYLLFVMFFCPLLSAGFVTPSTVIPEVSCTVCFLLNTSLNVTVHYFSLTSVCFAAFQKTKAAGFWEQDKLLSRFLTAGSDVWMSRILNKIDHNQDTTLHVNMLIESVYIAVNQIKSAPESALKCVYMPIFQ